MQARTQAKVWASMKPGEPFFKIQGEEVWGPFKFISQTEFLYSAERVGCCGVSSKSTWTCFPTRAECYEYMIGEKYKAIERLEAQIAALVKNALDAAPENGPQK